jgi:hypothetical protein
MNISTKKCSRCGKYKPYSEYWKKKSSPDGLQYYCKSCKRDYYGHQPKPDKSRPKGMSREAAKTESEKKYRPPAGGQDSLTLEKIETSLLKNETQELHKLIYNQRRYTIRDRILYNAFLAELEKRGIKVRTLSILFFE